jgi:hypothetical protein
MRNLYGAEIDQWRQRHNRPADYSPVDDSVARENRRRYIFDENGRLIGQRW